MKTALESKDVKLETLLKEKRMPDTESDATFSVKVVLVSAAMLGLILPVMGANFWLSCAIVGAAAYAYVAVARSREAARRIKANDSSR